MSYSVLISFPPCQKKFFAALEWQPALRWGVLHVLLELVAHPLGLGACGADAQPLFHDQRKPSDMVA